MHLNIRCFSLKCTRVGEAERKDVAEQERTASQQTNILSKEGDYYNELVVGITSNWPVSRRGSYCGSLSILDSWSVSPKILQKRFQLFPQFRNKEGPAGT